MKGARVGLVGIVTCLGVLPTGCGNGTTKNGSAVRVSDTTGSPVLYAQLEDNVKHDTLLIQTTFDLGDGTFIMVAGNVQETFEGIRLYRYRLLPDSAAEILAYSSPGYDSWTMLPTFFRLPHAPDAHMVLANFGERESWGQKLFLMDQEFSDLGFMDIALPERVLEDDTLRLKRRGIGSFARMVEHGDTSVFTFACDSVFLYDDAAGNMDQVMPAQSLRYTYHRDTGLELWLNGQRRAVPKPV